MNNILYGLTIIINAIVVLIIPYQAIRIEKLKGERNYYKDKCDKEHDKYVDQVKAFECHRNKTQRLSLYEQMDKISKNQRN